MLQFTRQWFRFVPDNKRLLFHHICILWILPETATRDKQCHINKWWNRRNPRCHWEITVIRPPNLITTRPEAAAILVLSDLWSHWLSAVAVKRICYESKKWSHEIHFQKSLNNLPWYLVVKLYFTIFSLTVKKTKNYKVNTEHLTMESLMRPLIVNSCSRQWQSWR